MAAPAPEFAGTLRARRNFPANSRASGELGFPATSASRRTRLPGELGFPAISASHDFGFPANSAIFRRLRRVWP
jgi:hypothetical protein